MRNVLISMGYNMQYATLSQFEQMLTAMSQSNWKRASQEAKSAIWCGQVGDRCLRYVAIIEAGCGEGSAMVKRPATTGEVAEADSGTWYDSAVRYAKTFAAVSWAIGR